MRGLSQTFVDTAFNRLTFYFFKSELYIAMQYYNSKLNNNLTVPYTIYTNSTFRYDNVWKRHTEHVNTLSILNLPYNSYMYILAWENVVNFSMTSV